MKRASRVARYDKPPVYCIQRVAVEVISPLVEKDDQCDEEGKRFKQVKHDLPAGERFGVTVGFTA
jgi:hypothetical protein